MKVGCCRVIILKNALIKQKCVPPLKMLDETIASQFQNELSISWNQEPRRPLRQLNSKGTALRQNLKNKKHVNNVKIQINKSKPNNIDAMYFEGKGKQR